MQVVVLFSTNLAHAEKYPWELNLNALNKQATNGDACAQYWMARTYLEGRLKQIPDTTRAAYWLERSAKNGYAVSQYKLADMYYFGEGVKQNYPEAIKWYKICALDSLSKSGDNLKAKITYAEIIGKGLHGEQKDLTGAIKLLSENRYYNFTYHKDGDKWDALKEELLGDFYFELSYNLNNALYLDLNSSIYSDSYGDDVKECMDSFQESANHYKNAVDKWSYWNQKYAGLKSEKVLSADHMAASHLGCGKALYFYNDFAEVPDYKEMMLHYLYASIQGNETAIRIRGELLLTGIGNISADTKEATSLLEQLVGKDIRATWLLAQFYYKNEQFKKAYKYYKAIADEKSKISSSYRSDAYSHLEKMYRFGYGVNQDATKEKFYHDRAAELGNADATYLNEINFF
jgi:TPR repeat protein